MTETPGQYVNKTWMEGKGSLFSSENPANGELLWEGKSSDAQDIDRAVQGAKEALSSWATLSFENRVEIISAFREQLRLHHGSLALTISQETGKPLWEAKNEVSSMEKKIPLSIQSYRSRCEEIQQEFPLYHSVTRHHPHGVVGILGPFNFPGHLPNGHIIPALLSGNTVVFKPSEKTPLTALHMLECWDRTLLPPGVIQLVQGDGSVGQQIAMHPFIKGLFFTGSYRTGKRLQEQSIHRPDCIFALEMGGNNPLLVGKCEDLRAAVYATLQSALLTSGQRCTCARRLLVPNGERGKQFLDLFIRVTENLLVAPYWNDPEPFMGPVIDAQSAHNLLAKQEEWLRQGAVALLPMRELPVSPAFVSPGILDVTSVSQRKDEEVFGPLLQVIRYDSFRQAIAEANATTYGLAAGLLSDDPEEYNLFYSRIHAGIVNWNAPLTGASSAAPFGGIGRSGNFHPSAFYAADYCSYPVASMEAEKITLPKHISPGVVLDG